MSEHLTKQPIEVREQEKRDITPPSRKDFVGYVHRIENDLQDRANYYGARRNNITPMGKPIDSLTKGEQDMLAYYDKHYQEFSRLSDAAYRFKMLIQAPRHGSELPADFQDQPIDADMLKNMSEVWQNKALHSNEFDAAHYNGAAEFAETFADNYELIVEEIDEIRKEREREAAAKEAYNAYRR